MKDSLLRHFRICARYNSLANGRLYDVCASLADGELKRPRPAFFKSILGTLNHMLIGDRIWLGRFAGSEMPSTGLDAILHGDLAELRAARETEDARIERFAEGLDTTFLARTIRYRNNEGRDLEDPAEILLAHFFNHQTHHRGQIHDMLSQTETAPPALDLHRVLRP